MEISMDPVATRKTLVELSRRLGDESRQLAILGEGNTSARISDGTFVVKASGSTLATMTDDTLVECRFAPLLAIMDAKDVSDEQVEAELAGCKVDPKAKKPSVEAMFHAYLLTLPGVKFVGHTHPVSVNQILCSPLSVAFSERRAFPDDIVCCGPSSVLIPYEDPGLKLAQLIRVKVQEYMARIGTVPRVILMENHGVITLGPTPESVEAAMRMTDKSARIFIGAAALGGPRFLTEDTVKRIGGRLDEKYRQKMLGL
jgi:rhamnose utilization protein RhaD (predicted bifunctional aldolase and dehydrogenase)